MSNNIPEIGILYEDEDIVVINKPAGLMVHPDGRDKGPFLTDWVMQKYPQTVGVGENTRTPQGDDILRPGIVHRLDRETSGALIITKTAQAHEHFKTQFKDRTITKKYIACVWGEVTEEFGTITRPIGRSSSDFRKWSAQRGARGELRDAETYWTKIGCGRIDSSEGSSTPITIVEVEPKTGRTHQIRVHFTALNHPVVGDVLYAPKKPMVLGFERTALHAVSIEFTTIAGKKTQVKAPLPNDFIHAAKLLGVKI